MSAGWLSTVCAARRAQGWLRPFAWDVVALALVLPLLLFFFIWRLDFAPSNVTGDEATYLNDVVRVLHAPERPGFFSLMGDGSQPAVPFYFMSAFAKVMGEDNAIWAMRTASAVLSIAALAAFYIYLRSRVALLPALSATVLLGTNFVFFNFVRSTWGVLIAGSFAFALLSFLCIETSLRKGQLWLAALAGILAGLSQYGYFGGKIFPLATALYLAYHLLRREFPWRRTVMQAAVYGLAALLVFLPQFLYIKGHYDVYTRRMDATSVFNVQKPYYGETDSPDILWHQLTYTVRGFLFLDPAVRGEGVENTRYAPSDEAPVDMITRILFFASLAALPWARKDIMQPAAAFLIMLLTGQLLTAFPPNYARGLFLLPFLYLLIGLLFHKVCSLPRWGRHLGWALVVPVMAISIWNVQHYFDWGSSQELAAARSPAFCYQETPLWIATQKAHLAAGQYDLVITSQEWQDLVSRVRADGSQGGRDLTTCLED